MNEILLAAKAGIIDGFVVSNDMFGAGPSNKTKRFDDRDLGERVRAKTLAGFSEEIKQL